MPRAIAWPDLVFAADWRGATLSDAARSGRLRRIARGLYTPSTDPDATVVRRNWIAVLERHFRGAVIVDRSARTGSPDATGHLYVDHPSRTTVVLPGLGGRPDIEPGVFKRRANRAGASVFVSPDLVEGTLRDGFGVGRSLLDPFARAVYLMFLVSEVHPFADGNGRVARVMMNAELVAGCAVRIIIPTVFRGEYLSSLKAATNLGRFESLMAVMTYAQRWTAQVDFTNRVTAEQDLARTHALVEPDIAEDNNLRLRLPSALDRVDGVG